MFSDTTISDFLDETISVLAGLDTEVRSKLISSLEVLSLPGGHILFEQGEMGDCMYILASGSLGVSVRSSDGSLRRIARLSPPETVGEMALLSGAPRSSTVIALRDSVLFRLSVATFKAVLAQSPNSMRYLAQLLASRLRRADQVREIRYAPTTFAAISVTAGVEVDAFIAQLRTACAAGNISTAILMSAPANADEQWFHNLEVQHRRVVYVAGGNRAEWHRLCLRRADHLLLLAQPGEPLTLQSDDRLCSDHEWRRRDLIVIQDRMAAEPASVHATVDALPVQLRVQVRQDCPEDFTRLLRIVEGRALGLVLSGGGARGLAHVGVLRALHEAGRSPDLVGGTSIGAVIAACSARGWSVEEIADRVRQAFVESPSLDDYTFPIVALLKGYKVDRRLAQHFGGVRIENLWRPFFCVSANLTTGKPEIHKCGDLTKALRASIAIPGLLPPVIAPEGVLVDGGVLNNLPADVMADLQRGPVLAVDVARDLALQAHPGNPTTTMLHRMIGLPLGSPSIVSLLIRAGTVSGDAQVTMTRLRADAVLQPLLTEIGLRDWRAFDRAVATGYAHAKAAIEEGLLDATCHDLSTPRS